MNSWADLQAAGVGILYRVDYTLFIYLCVCIILRVVILRARDLPEPRGPFAHILLQELSRFVVVEDPSWTQHP